MERESSPRAIIFDLDGTLLDTVDDLAGSMNAVLESWGCPTHETRDYLPMIGHGVNNLVRAALPEEYRSSEYVTKAVGLMIQDYALRWRENTRPYPGITELLDALSQRGVPLAILSNKPHRETTEIVKTLLGEWSFEVVLGFRDNVPRKPDPSAALEIAAIMGYPSDRFLLVGDTEADMETAQRAGMGSVAVTWGFRSPSQLRDAGADFIIDKPSELTALLESG